MFILTQIIGLLVVNAYSPRQEVVFNETTQSYENITVTPYLPYGMQPPEIEPRFSFVSIIISFAIAIVIIFLLMTIKARRFLRLWFFLVVTMALGLTFNAFLKDVVPYSALISIIIALPFSIFKIFKRNMLIHNISELFIYPGIAAVFVSILNVQFTFLLLLLISAYDIYAVWHSGFMQKMAKFQINELKFFTGFFVPYLGKKNRLKIQEAKKTKDKKNLKKIKVNLAILGGGDVVFPIIMAGVVLRYIGLIHSIFVILGATMALFLLFLMSKKGKFYPAMPFITSGILFALALSGLLFY